MTGLQVNYSSNQQYKLHMEKTGAACAVRMVYTFLRRLDVGFYNSIRKNAETLADNVK